MPSTRISLRDLRNPSRSSVGSPVRPVGAGPVHPVSHCRLGQVELLRDPADCLSLIEHEPHGARSELMKRRRGRLDFAVSAIVRIVSAFRKCPRDPTRPQEPK